MYKQYAGSLEIYAVKIRVTSSQGHADAVGKACSEFTDSRQPAGVETGLGRTRRTDKTCAAIADLNAAAAKRSGDLDCPLCRK